MPDEHRPDDHIVAARENLRDLGTVTVTAADKAQEVTQQAAQNGFRVTSERIGYICEQIRRLTAMVSHVATSLESASTLTSNSRTRPVLNDAMEDLQQARILLDKAGSACTEMATQLTHHKGGVAAALNGGQPGPLLAILEQIEHKLRPARNRIHNGASSIADLIKNARTIGAEASSHEVTSGDITKDPATAASEDSTLTRSQRRAIRSLERRIDEHVAKLDEYVRDPEGNDNDGRLARAPNDMVREKILTGRIRHLRTEIAAFRGDIDRIRRGEISG